MTRAKEDGAAMVDLCLTCWGGGRIMSGDPRVAAPDGTVKCQDCDGTGRQP